jgi:hypothetical protein
LVWIADEHGGPAGIIVEQLQTGAKVSEIGTCPYLEFHSDLNAGITPWERVPVEINRNDPAERNGKWPLGLSEYNAVGIDGAVVNDYTVCLADVSQVNAGGLADGNADRSSVYDEGIGAGRSQRQESGDKDHDVSMFHTLTFPFIVLAFSGSSLLGSQAWPFIGYLRKILTGVAKKMRKVRNPRIED